MSDPLSLLQRATKADVQTDPFPYIVIENALPDDIYERLARSYPPLWLLKVDRSKSNTRWDYEARRVRKNLLISRAWKKFIAYQTSQGFYREVIDLFYDEIHRLYPERFPNYESLANLTTGVRRSDTFDTRQVLMDAQIAGNTPVVTPNSVRTTHIDQGAKLFSGLFYMRLDDDETEGGDLTISRFKPHYTMDEKLKTFSWAYVDDQHVETLRTIKYKKNCVVMFINTLESLHGVTVRSETKKPRLFVNLLGEVNPPLYVLSRTGELPYYTGGRPAEPLRAAS